MTCRPITVGGLPAIVCGRIPVKRCACSVEAGFLCDWKKGGGMTCDKPLCAEHATEVSPGKHLCPEHNAAWETHPKNPTGNSERDRCRHGCASSDTSLSRDGQGSLGETAIPVPGTRV